MFVKEKKLRIMKKRQKFVKVPSEMWTYQSSICTSAQSLVTVLGCSHTQLTPAAIRLPVSMEFEMLIPDYA